MMTSCADAVCALTQGLTSTGFLTSSSSIASSLTSSSSSPLSSCSDAICALTQGLSISSVSTSHGSSSPVTTSPSTLSIRTSSSLSRTTSTTPKPPLPTLPPTVISTASNGDVFSGVVSISDHKTSWISSTRISHLDRGTPVTILSTTRSASSVSVFRCGGFEISGHSSCTESPQLVLISKTTPPPSEQTEICGSWMGPLTTSSPAMVGKYNCAFPTDGTGLPGVNSPDVLQPFRPDEDLIDDFCKYMVLNDITIYSGRPDGKKAPGECAHYVMGRLLNQEELPFSANNNFGMTIAVAFDYNGCSSPDDKHKDGISFSDYGEHKCHDNLWKTLVNKCQFDNPEKMGLSKFPAVGGLLWKDCMRWTVLSVSDSYTPPDTLSGHDVIMS
ncbi:hypothetical protein A1O1_09213 [Capronia coronata CBS 617.96]|uniref:Uncharacterized protein n=1 Tax=Capronia coronata CBS 617.96 TaxID=1182541 RepID=W9XPA9_9EURO|nr:uncharacterized protein A1O1_09213 [Capronia coronata CBS 617.96]EXJ78811.1 hypothetical protein A1O1_09213 [Capronia coronata CBS 617.96]